MRIQIIHFMLWALMLIHLWSVLGCSNKNQTDKVSNAPVFTKPDFGNLTLSYLPFANSASDNPPTSIGLVDSVNPSQNFKLSENSNTGNINFLYATAFNYLDDSAEPSSIRERDLNATFIHTGFFNAATRQIQNFHAESFLYARGGRLYQQPIWQTTIEEPAAISAESRFFNNELCSIGTKGNLNKKFLFVAEDFANKLNSIILYKKAKVSVNAQNISVKSCAQQDVQWKYVTLGMSSTSAPFSIPYNLTGGILQPLYDLTTGMLNGWIANDANLNVYHFDANFTTQTQIQIPTHNGDADNNNDWIVFLGLDTTGTNAWFATHGQHVYQYNLISRELVYPAGSALPALDVLPDQGSKLQVYGAYKNDYYPLYQFDENYLYLMTYAVSPVSVYGTTNQYLYQIRRVAIRNPSMPETIATFEAYNIGKMMLTSNKIVVSITRESVTREGTEFLMFDKHNPQQPRLTVFPSSGHRCLFNMFSFNDNIYGNSVGLNSCQEQTTDTTHIHFFRFNETGQASYVDSHHSRLLSLVQGTHFDLIRGKGDIAKFIIKRNVVKSDVSWIDSLIVYDPLIGADVRTLGQLDNKLAAISARVSMISGFDTGFLEYEISTANHRLSTFSTLTDNSLTRFAPSFTAQSSNRWIAPFTLPP